MADYSVAQDKEVNKCNFWNVYTYNPINACIYMQKANRIIAEYSHTLYLYLLQNIFYLHELGRYDVKYLFQPLSTYNTSFIQNL
jgi:hypothetical protein